MMKFQSKSRSALSAFVALSLALALMPIAGAKAYGEEGDELSGQTAGSEEVRSQESNEQQGDASDPETVDTARGTDGETEGIQEGDSQKGAPQKEEGTVVILPSEEDMEKSMIGLDELADSDSGISTFSLDAETRAASGVAIESYSGADRVETSVLTAKAAFPTSDYAIIAGSDSCPTRSPHRVWQAFTSALSC
ncbi:hypothetical protein [Raoultibacter massiliensis]|uniref:hypothetical protein n=1 Tax=Raoultibacter massiliensis TaxID=1852371 RepID=UPI003A90BC47